MARNITIAQILTLLILAAILMSLFAGCAGGQSEETYSGTVAAVESSCLVAAGETGPTLTGVLLKLNTKVDAVDTDSSVRVLTNGTQRTVESAYLADKNGETVSGSSAYVCIMLKGTGEDVDELLDMNDEQHLEWSDSYELQVSVGIEKDGSSCEVSYSSSELSDVVSEELSLFSVNDTFSGTYENPLTGQTDELTLTWAAYEPETLSGGEQNPLIIWLHGRWEGGTDLSEAILGNQVSALAGEQIQSYFSSDDGSTGAYVLLVQTPTYWMDAGDGEEGEGDRCSRYTEILMDTILNYVRENPDVDPDRIYLGGGSNGGYMTVEMLIHYPDFFAAGFPVSEAYSAYNYMTDRSGNYITGFRGENIAVSSNLSESDIEALCSTPIWFVQTITDAVVSAEDCALPIYEKLLRAGADNCWLSLYDRVQGEEEGTEYNNHWAWIYLFNDSVEYVQDTQSVLSGRSFFGGWGGFGGWGSGVRWSANAYGGTVSVSDDTGGSYDSIFAWLNAQSL